MQISRIVREAANACQSFAGYQSRYFDFERRPGYRGWENWLTVDIGRRLNHKNVLAFHGYPTGRERFDLYVEGATPIAVEVKVNYLDQDEIQESGPERDLPPRVVSDAEKLNTLNPTTSRLLLVSTCFERSECRRAYKRLVAPSIARHFPNWEHEWRDCSDARNKGWNLLLALWKDGSN